MFGWRTRNVGFEWREYVRTTILVRRKNRRERVGHAAKGAVHNLTKTLAVELAPDKIRVCAIAPVATDTPLLPTFLGPAPGMREKFIATVPLGRLATAQDIADAALFLASDEAKFLTGNIMEVDGGRCV